MRTFFSLHNTILALFLSAFAVLGTLSQTLAAEAKKPSTEIRLATTTSTEASGLLAVILPLFERDSGIRVQVISVGTGQALKLGERGDVDIVLVHSRPDEDKFMAAGFGSVRYDVMYNDFIIVGPQNDPAKLRGLRSASSALQVIAEANAVSPMPSSPTAKFISRGDDSGTHKKELALWNEVGIIPKDIKSKPWYIEAGQGMGEVLTMAGNLQAYTLSDRGTFNAYRNRVGLDVIVSEVPGLFNPYGIMPVNPAKHAHTKHEAAMKFANWIVSSAGRAAILSLKVDSQSLFTQGTPPIK